MDTYGSWGDQYRGVSSKPRQAFSEGYTAFRENLPVNANPYASGSELGDHWWDGYDEAQFDQNEVLTDFIRDVMT